MPAEAIRRYHDLLASGTLAADSTAELDRLQDLRGLRVGDRAVCAVLRPRFLTPGQYRRLRDQVALVLPALRAVADRALADPTFRRQLRLQPWEEALVAIDPGYHDPAPASRLDGYFGADGRLRFTEFNADAPAGAAYADTLSGIFHAVPAFREFQRAYHVGPVPNRPGVLHALLDAYRQWKGGGNTDLPRVAILDWREVPTYHEFVLFANYLRWMGIDARTVDPRAVDYSNGQLWADDFPVSLVYKRVLTRELIERGGADHPVIRAARDRAVCVVNSLRCKVIARKASFAAITDERNDDLFTPAQRRAVADHVPWTRLLEERTTMFDGRPVDLVPFALRHRERFVLKPNDASGGKGVVLGAEVGAGSWEEAVVEGLKEPAWVIQERVPAAVEPYPTWSDGGLEITDRVVDTGLFVAGGSYAHGCLTRVSTGPVVAVATAGACAVPTFLVEPR